MDVNVTRRHSLKTRITLVSLVIFVVSIWSLLFYFSWVLQKDLQQQIGEQQFAMASVLTEYIDQELNLRLKSLEGKAAKITPAIISNAPRLQQLLEESSVLDILFNGGFFVIKADGITIADFPVSTGRTGMDISEKGWMIAALQGKPAIGKPVIGKKLQVPVFTMAVPVCDPEGRVIAVLAGAVDLSKPNFLDKISGSRYGRTGGYLLVAPQHKLIVMATDKTRIMQPMPAPGTNSLFDRYNQGFEGFGRAVNSFGIEEITASKHIPAAGWFLIVKTPVKDAFAKFYHTQKHIIAATILFTLLVGCLIWWVLKRQLSPIVDTVSTLVLMSEGSLPTSLLPVVHQDEIGQLVSGFNKLLKTKEIQNQSLLLSEERFRKAIEEAPFPIMIHAEDGEVLALSRTWSELSGYERADIPTTAIWAEKAYGTSKQAVLIDIEALYTLEHRSHEGEYHITCRDGSRRIWDFSSVSISFLSDGRRTAMSMAADVTGRKLIEDKIALSEYRFRSLFEEMLEGVALHTVIRNDAGKVINYRIEAVNPSFSGILGITCDQVLGKLATDAYDCDSPPYLEEYVQVVQSRKPFRFETWYQRIDKHFDISVIPWEENGFATIFLDITDRIKTEELQRQQAEQFQQTQKLESLGVLAGGIAHDFNNILAIIMGYCALTRMDYETAEHNILEIEKATERAAGLCRQMLVYAGKSSYTQTQVDTPALVDEIITMLKTTIKQNVVINSRLSSSLPAITGDASQIRQVVMNLIINAAEAIDDAKGEVNVTLAETEIMDGHQEKDYIGMLIPAGDYICLQVSDNGCGMDADTQKRIFEPFYTTKFTGRGLGMSAVLGIIKAHNGALQLASQQGHGTTFRVWLPVQTGSRDVEESHPEAVSEYWQGSGTILLVEDEEQIKLIGKALLEKLGFKVIAAANGEEALVSYRRHAADITLVITDMGMPVMNGYELFDKLKQLNPQLPIIVSSGFGAVDVTDRIPGMEIAGLINKPYDFDRLREVLKRVIDDSRIKNGR